MHVQLRQVLLYAELHLILLVLQLGEVVINRVSQVV